MKRAFLILVSLLAALALAACGGGHHKSSSTTTSSTTTTTSSTTATSPPVTSGTTTTPGPAPSQQSTVVKTITAPSGQRSYKVKLPNGKVVTQAHSPALAEPPKGLLKATPPASLTGTAEQYDSVTTSTIPRSAHYVAGYVDGLFKTYRLLLGHFPVVVGISVSTRDGADCFDMEPGNPGPTNAAPWAEFQFRAGNTRPCEYSMLSWMPAIKANLAQHGVAVCSSSTSTHCVRLWDANWTYARHLDGGYACTQWTDHAGGLNLDESTCASWFYSQSKPAPPPKPASAFAIFPTLKLHTPYGTWTERQLAESIDGALQHKAKFSSYLKNVLDPAALWFAHRIDFLAFNVWPKPRPDWKANRGGPRRACLVHAAGGTRIG